MNGIVLPPIQINAAAPGYTPPTASGAWPAPNPAMVFIAQQQERNQFYSQGLWREMIIKITNEQQSSIRNGVAVGIVSSIVRDMQAIPFADNYICLNPNMSPAQALHYTSSYFKAGSVPESIGLSGGLLTPIAAFGHFLYGNGASAEANINSLGLNLSGTSIPMLESAFVNAPVGRTSIALDKVPYNTSSDSWMTASWLGNITLKIEGVIIKQENGKLSFNGGARAYNDIYDANPSTFRSAIGESATSVLAAVEKYLNAKPYEISLQGTNLIFISR
ncbi:lipid II-degrading bacteriocin [Pseudomonas sp. fls2-241-R2A-110]|uniref:lipid II-degrading bacteriocin n=1 Tax=Pseudomonas sp. fls2-241-R2A-110 TaxID=3040311 RepID=UPI002553520A|nr:lipid II-degrading bacteriocin [Pseudomonas sp. fls2-241-R2A-110]